MVGDHVHVFVHREILFGVVYVLVERCVRELVRDVALVYAVFLSPLHLPYVLRGVRREQDVCDFAVVVYCVYVLTCNLYVINSE